MLLLLASSAGAAQGDPARGREPYRHYCAACHGSEGRGNGVNTPPLPTAPRDFTDGPYMAGRTDQQLFDAISGGGFAVNRSVLMPLWGKTLSPPVIQDLVAFIRSLARETRPPAPRILATPHPRPARGDPAKGQRLYRYYCALCHGEGGEGDGINAYNLDPKPRDFTDGATMSARSDEALAAAIQDGGWGVHRSMLMPSWRRTLGDEEPIWDLVAYLRTLHPRVALPPVRTEELPLTGEVLLAELGCKGCHRIADTEASPVAPTLSHLGDKLRGRWLAAFLKDPTTLRPIGYLPLSRSRMPSLRLTDEEARSLAAFLLTLRGPAPAPGPPVPAPFLVTGKELFERSGCVACHRHEGSGGIVGPDLSPARERLQRGWMIAWLQDPQAHRPDAPMPNFGFTRGEVELLADYLLAPAAPPAPELPPSPAEVERGKKLVAALNCAACHVIEGFARTAEVAPDLTYVGDKLRRAWLAPFLKQPEALRLWLELRMPTFRLTDGEAEALTNALMARKNPKLPPLPGPLRYTGQVSRAWLEEGGRYFEALKCRSCHPVRGQLLQASDTSQLAPDFERSAERLNPDWVYHWLKDPQAVEPDTKMPNFFYESGEPLLDEPERKLLALRDYLMSLGAPPRKE
ncbi:MAG: c-type cytochrome [Deltaproteobacteria bacterium]|nr:c-type cytochrome [Deltaproteobacteria bacterium]